MRRSQIALPEAPPHRRRGARRPGGRPSIAGRRAVRRPLVGAGAVRAARPRARRSSCARTRSRSRRVRCGRGRATPSATAGARSRRLPRRRARDQLAARACTAIAAPATTVVLFGDSHAMQYFPALERLALAPRTGASCSSPKAGCPPSRRPRRLHALATAATPSATRWREYALRRDRAHGTPGARGRLRLRALHGRRATGTRLSAGDGLGALADGFGPVLTRLRRDGTARRRADRQPAPAARRPRLRLGVACSELRRCAFDRGRVDRPRSGPRSPVRAASAGVRVIDPTRPLLPGDAVPGGDRRRARLPQQRPRHRELHRDARPVARAPPRRRVAPARLIGEGCHRPTEEDALSATGQELAEVDTDVETGHGSESFFIEGEGLLTASRGGREVPAATAGAAATAPPFRFSRMGPKGSRPLARGIRKKVAQAMMLDGGRRRHDPRRLHVPRAVHRPRPDVRQDDGRARDRRVARRTCCRAARPRWTWTRCTAPGRRTPTRRGFYEADGRS